MARHRPNISRQLKRTLLREAGEKCANPGCSATRTEFHHIREWHVYESHDQQHMIAICPNCHDAVHHGKLPITDETLYRWKQIERVPSSRGHIYIEPRTNPRAIPGGNELIGPPNGFFAFNLSPQNVCSVRVLDDEILLLNLKLSTAAGREVIRFMENHWTYCEGDLVTLSHVPGHIRISTVHPSEFLPEWVREGVRLADPTFSPSAEIALLDLEVVEPGLVTVTGVWVDEITAVVANSNGLFFTGNSKSGEPLPAAIITNCIVDLSRNGIVSPTLFRIGFPDRDPKRFHVRIGY